MRLGTDHSPMMTKILGIDEEGASFTSSESIPPEDIEWGAVMVYQNPHYTPEAEQMMLKMLKQNQDALMRRGAEAMKNEIGVEEE